MIELLPPQAIEAEQNVLGVLLLNNAAWDRVCDVVTEQDFYRLEHRIIFRQIAGMIDENRPADPLTVGDILPEQRAYLGELAMNCVAISNVRRYAEIVRDRSQKRAVITVAADMSERAFQAHGDAGELVEGAVEQLYRLQARNGRKAARGMSAVLSAVIEKIDALYCREDKRAVVGIASGFVDLDHKTAGFQPGDLIIVAGRPSMGKTALAMNVAEHVAVTLKLPALVFSLEMADEQLVQRMLGSVGHLDQHALRTGTFQESDWSKVTETVGVLNEAPIIIEDTSGLTASDVRASAHRAHRESGGLGIIVIDYLQLMSTAGDNRNNELGEITRALKALAKELKVPVVVLSQLNRDVEKRGNRRPIMSDLRDSGSIEQDADLILFLYRDEVYHPETQHKGIAEVIIGKQRNGPIGTVYLTFLERFTRFENFAGEPPAYHQSAPKVRNFNDYKQRAAGDE